MQKASFVKHLLLAVFGLAALALPFLAGRAHGEPLTGSVAAHVERVIDGDTVAVTARIWVGQTLAVDVRLAGIDAPEIGAHARCAFERDKAEAAKTYLSGLIGGREVMLTDIATDKYGGRVDARILLGGADVGQLMLKQGLARAYDGGRKSPWCAPGEIARTN